MTTLALSENDGAFCFLFGDFVMEVARGNGPTSRTVIHADRAVEHPIRIFEDGAGRRECKRQVGRVRVGMRGQVSALAAHARKRSSCVGSHLEKEVLWKT